MTEDEAKTKWCPFSERANKNDHCLGSECMAWRWIVDSPDSGYFADGTSIEGDACLTSELSAYGGYCGLSGKP